MSSVLDSRNNIMQHAASSEESPIIVEDDIKLVAVTPVKDLPKEPDYQSLM